MVRLQEEPIFISRTFLKYVRIHRCEFESRPTVINITLCDKVYQ